MTRVPAPLRRQIRERARSRCEYCLVPEEHMAYPFHVDHIIPIKRHGVTTTEENLAWACFNCNTTKSDNIASYDTLTKTLEPLFNPRTQNWNDHFEMRGAEIIGKTPIGRVTVRILQMNDDDQVKFRHYLINAGLW
jgi:5-methylcytosine-specific restriction endonuclease McrA